MFIWLMLFWSVAAYAAQATFVHDLSDIPPVAVAISCLLSIIGGAAFTAQKIADPAVTIVSPVKTIIRDVLNSIVAGLLVFCIGSYFNWAAVAQAGLITLAGYGGSRVLEPVLSALIDRLSKFVGGGAQ
ncbi:hypothetical protein Bcep1808_7730 (plasmid) [Burkholderia vietnamiensis G4]|uniref:Holin n=1 Tax=Burkholderia vietnamiensis (strain G4 / LMG 22486) TaxID=269482 RepID=A4JWE7_BURVG|nr:hypothetical protein Bcep1808_7730 [Burkholderia vietnamiensis G4]